MRWATAVVAFAFVVAMAGCGGRPDGAEEASASSDASAAPYGLGEHSMPNTDEEVADVLERLPVEVARYRRTEVTPRSVTFTRDGEPTSGSRCCRSRRRHPG